ncbi:MAG: hypothetical protein JWM75_867 [Sphingomonas bacterium]|nr:hypothetical protein [Sphingomonas bacterium]
MAARTKIEWTDATWNLVTGCSVRSAGCTNCYAMRLAGTRMKGHPSREGLTIASKAGPVWTGEIRFNREWLDQPLRLAKPRHIFVCAHSDLFHEGVTDTVIDLVFAVMALAPQHEFQVLTKRSARMRQYLQTPRRRDSIAAAVAVILTEGRYRRAEQVADERGYGLTIPQAWWPLPNVVGMVSAEDQDAANERIPDLIAAPFAKRDLSLEPLLGPIDLSAWLWRNALPTGLIRQVIVGGESGAGARPMPPDWARSLRDQCRHARVAFSFKQWGEWVWSDHDASMVMVGKKAAGRLLDGVQHDGVRA